MFEWTTERPTEPGYYWVRHTGDVKSPIIVELVIDGRYKLRGHKLRVDCSYVGGYAAEIELSLRDCTAFARVPKPEQIEALRKGSNP